MTTKVRPFPQVEVLHIGDNVETAPEDLPGTGYLIANNPEPGEKDLRLLDVWECPNCKYPYNCAEIVIHDSIIQSITPVRLDLETLRRVHGVSWMVEEIYERLSPEPLPPRNRLEAELVGLLRAWLEAHPGQAAEPDLG